MWLLSRKDLHFFSSRRSEIPNPNNRKKDFKKSNSKFHQCPFEPSVLANEEKEYFFAIQINEALLWEGKSPFRFFCGRKRSASALAAFPEGCMKEEPLENEFEGGPSLDEFP
jgi:hypothetical protein